MRMFLVTLLLVLGGFHGLSIAEEYEIIQVGKGANCKWSPDGQYLSFTSRGGLYVYVVDSGTVRQVTPAENVYYMNKHNYDWVSSDKLIFIRRERSRSSSGRVYKTEYVTFSLDGAQEVLYSETTTEETYHANRLKRLSNGKVGICREEVIDIANLKQMLGKSEIDTTAYYVTSFSVWITRYLGIENGTRDVWLVYSDGRPYKRVTMNKTYGLPILSPDGIHILCRVGGITILDLDGRVVSHVDNADAESWFPDSRRLVFARTVEAHDDIVASDLYIVDMTGENEVRITDTPDKIELDPVVSPDMSKIAYENYASDANYIEIIDMKEALK